MSKNMKFRLPEMMKAVRQHEPGGELVLESVPVPRPEAGEVLIRMVASPLNPSDLALLRGGYMERKYPFTPGLEGSGMVVQSGGGLLAGLRKGKMVACTPDSGGDGTWAEYMKTSVMHTVTLPPKISPEQGAMMLVNPMTAMAFIDIARRGNHKALVNNAAASALGKMLIRLTNHYRIPLISIVRREEHVDELKALGGKHVLNSKDPSFEDQLKKLSAELNATLYLDAIAGDQTSVLLRSAPGGSLLLIYARLSGDPLVTGPELLMREDKQIRGFLLGNWLQTKGLLFKLRFINRLKKQMPGLLASQIHRVMPLEAVEEAISMYKKEMSSGKIILDLEMKEI
jgi:NADPH:quinone reductase-like Zn-dependent oxidoreductase